MARSVTAISGRLRTARERAGLTIEDISARTKITASALRSIERGQFDRLPGEFYTRAFLKAYAREVHVPPDEIIREYEGADDTSPPDVAPAIPRRPGAHPLAALAPSEPDPPQQASRPALRLAWSSRQAGAVLVLALLLMAVAFRRGPLGHNDRPEAGAVGTSAVAEAATLPTDPAPGAVGVPDRLILEIQPTAPIWVTGAADGKRMFSRLLAPGERVRLEARQDLSFRIGNAVAFSYTINGLPGKPLGGPDEIREFQITPENYLTYRR